MLRRVRFAEPRLRITSYNVCYTKLLRFKCSRHGFVLKGIINPDWNAEMLAQPVRNPFSSFVSENKQPGPRKCIRNIDSNGVSRLARANHARHLTGLEDNGVL